MPLQPIGTTLTPRQGARPHMISGPGFSNLGYVSTNIPERKLVTASPNIPVKNVAKRTRLIRPIKLICLLDMILCYIIHRG